MMDAQAAITDALIAELTALLDEWQNHPTDRFAKAWRSKVPASAYNLFRPNDPHRFSRACRLIHTTHVRFHYQALRRAQLLDGKYRLWIYKSDAMCGKHNQFEGLCLPSDHKFWNTHFPANGWLYHCKVRGADNLPGIYRAHGNPHATLPAGWDQIDTSTGLPIAIEIGFGTSVPPDLRACLEAISRGLLDRIDA